LFLNKKQTKKIMTTRTTMPKELRAANTDKHKRNVFATYVDEVEEIDIHASERMAELNRRNSRANLPSSMR